jgi:DNA-3-methyladenine glycosylase
MDIKGKKLTRGFYTRTTLDVAEDLLRKTIVYHCPKGLMAADIVETEAYIGEDDPACHAAVGPTERNRVMYGRGGHSYIYFIYGMYHCFNIVTEKAGYPAAVLLRAVEPVLGQELMAANSPRGSRLLTNGPGKFCRAFGLTRKHNGMDLTGSQIYIIDRKDSRPRIESSSRIGIKKGADRPWRFYDAASRYISR